MQGGEWRAKGRERERKKKRQGERKKTGERHNHRNPSPSVFFFFFLGRGYSERRLCSAAVQRFSTSEKSPSLHSIHPIEPPAPAINSEPCAVTEGLWTQQLAAGRQALFHTIRPPISCTQLSSSGLAIQGSTAAAAASASAAVAVAAVAAGGGGGKASLTAVSVTANRSHFTVLSFLPLPS